MPEHITGERLSALLADDTPTDEEQRHLDGCPACDGELRRMRRMRMALSALDDLEAPDDGWERIAGALPDRGSVDGAAAEGVEPVPGKAAERRAPPSAWDFGGAWLRAAAAVVLFAGGLALGTRLSGPGGGADASARTGETAGERVAAAEASPDGASPADRAGDGGTANRRTAAGASGTGDPASAAELADVGDPPLEAYRNPAAAAERLARLDAMMQAAREAIREDPSDPAVNDLLFRVAEDRQALIEALHLATLEYR